MNPLLSEIGAMNMSSRSTSHLVEQITALDGVKSETEPGPFQETMTYFHYGTREIGHLHGDDLAHIPFPRAVRDELYESGRARQHSAGFASHVEVDLHADGGLKQAVELLQMSHARALAAAERKAARSD